MYIPNLHNCILDDTNSVEVVGALCELFHCKLSKLHWTKQHVAGVSQK